MISRPKALSYVWSSSSREITGTESAMTHYMLFVEVSHGFIVSSKKLLHKWHCRISDVEIGPQAVSGGSPATTTTLNTCTTTDALSRYSDGQYDTAGTACIFPWYHSGPKKWFTGCADVSGYEHWCPTEVNCDGTYRKWGYCESSCIPATTTTTTTAGPPGRCTNTGSNPSYKHGSFSKWECDGR